MYREGELPTSVPSGPDPGAEAPLLQTAAARPEGVAQHRLVQEQGRFFTWLYRIGVNEAKRRIEREP